MSSIEKLPDELWLIILDLVISSTIGSPDHCNYLNFPDIIQHLREPLKHPPVDTQWLRDLRLVCRTFRILIESPYFIVREDNSTIPANARALFINPSFNPETSLQRLFADPAKSRRIVVLNLPGGEWNLPGGEWRRAYRSKAISPTFIWENAHLLPSLRSLTIGLEASATLSMLDPEFYRRLNDAFPRLTCLMLRGGIWTMPSIPVTFESVEILSMDTNAPHPTVQFPALRHAAFGSMTGDVFERFTVWPHLESLVVRFIDQEMPFRWDSFPKLRLFAMQGQAVWTVNTLPRNHPLQHLHIFIGTIPRDDHNQLYDRHPEDVKWLTRTSDTFPTVQQISIEFEKGGIAWLGWSFDEEELEDMGFALPRDKNMYGNRRKVLERIRPHGVPNPKDCSDLSLDEKPDSGALDGSHAKGLRARWDRFVQSSSRRLHL